MINRDSEFPGDEAYSRAGCVFVLAVATLLALAGCRDVPPGPTDSAPAVASDALVGSR